MKKTGITLAVLAASLWGVMGIFVRNLTAAGLSSVELSFLRCLLAGGVYFLILLLRKPQFLKINLKGLVICLLYGAISYGICFPSYNEAVSRIPVAVATVLMFMSPIWVTLLSVVVFREKPEKSKLLAILICMVGAILVSDLLHAASGEMDLFGVVAAMANGFGMALQIMIPRYFAKDYQRDTMLVYGFLGAALALAFFTDFTHLGAALQGGDPGSLVFNILAVSLLCTLVANGAYVKATGYTDTTTVSIFSALEVVVGSAVGFFLFRESLSPLQAAGAVIIVLGALGPELLSRRKQTV